MPEEIRVNRPAPAAMPQQAPRQEPMPSQEVGHSGNSKMPWIVLGVVVLVLVVVGFLFRDKLFKGGKQDGQVQGVSVSAYQAVFLTNGQVYFGKITESDDNYVTVTDIYYLQVVQPPLQGQVPAGQEQPAAGQAQPQISLVKLGQELHGPVDEMHISRSQILFYEDLKSDSQVVKAISDYKTNPQNTQPIK